MRVHRALKRAGAIADLNVYEGESHAQFLGGPAVPDRAKPSPTSPRSSTSTWGNDTRIGRARRGADEGSPAKPLKCLRSFTLGRREYGENVADERRRPGARQEIEGKLLILLDRLQKAVLRAPSAGCRAVAVV